MSDHAYLSGIWGKEKAFDNDYIPIEWEIIGEQWINKKANNIPYLLADQETSRGHNKIVFSCFKKHDLFVTAFSRLSDGKSVVNAWQHVLLVIDGKTMVIPTWAMMGAPEMSGEYVTWAFTLTPELAAAVETAKQIGSGVSTGSEHEFAGVAGIDVGDGRSKLKALLESCS